MDRPDLHRQILDYWIQQFTEVIVDSPEFLKDDPADGLLAAITRVRREGLEKYELAMRAWADQDSLADKVVRQVYARRTEFVHGFFRRMGFRGLEAEIRTRLTLCYLSWEPNMYPDESAVRQVKLLKLQHELLTRKS